MTIWSSERVPNTTVNAGSRLWTTSLLRRLLGLSVSENGRQRENARDDENADEEDEELIHSKLSLLNIFPFKSYGVGHHSQNDREPGSECPPVDGLAWYKLPNHKHGKHNHIHLLERASEEVALRFLKPFHTPTITRYGKAVNSWASTRSLRIVNP